MRSRLRNIVVRLASPAGTVARIIAVRGPGLTGLGLLSYGAWLAWQPAGWMTAGAVVLADQAYGAMKGRRDG